MKRDSENSYKENRHHVRFWKLAGLIFLFFLLGFTLTAFTFNGPQQLDSISFNQDGSSAPPDTGADTGTPESPDAPEPAAVGAAELSIIKSVIPDEAGIGEQFEFKIVIENTGDAPALNIKVTDDFPDVLRIDSVNCTEVCTITIDHNQNQVIVDIGSLDVGKEITITVYTTVHQNAVASTYNNKAEMDYFDGAQTVSISSDVDFKIKAAPTGTAVLYAVKSVKPQQAVIGQQLTFEIVIKNEGDGLAEDIYVKDIFPIFLTIDPHGVYCSKDCDYEIVLYPATTDVTVYIAKLKPDKSVLITILATVNQSTSNVQYPCNTAEIEYYNGQKTVFTESNRICFNVLPGGVSSVLPGTGGMEINQGQPRSLNQLFLTGSISLGVIGLLILVYGLRVKSHRPNKTARFVNAGILLLVVGFILTLTACGLQNSTVSKGQLTPDAAQGSLVQPTDLISETSSSDSEGPAEQISTSTPSSLPDYPIPTPYIPAGLNVDGKLPDTSPITRIEIPALELDTIVKYVPFDGFTWLIKGLRSEVIWMGNTSWPGLGGNTGVSAHLTLDDGTDGPFRHLEDLKDGEIVKLYTEQNVYTYKVHDQEVVSESDTSVLEPAEQARLTLITCTDWHIGLGTYQKRLIVYSDLVEVQPLEIQISSN
jgi:LPXTG-site transpeptidase (sortase) family protein